MENFNQQFDFSNSDIFETVTQKKFLNTGVFKFIKILLYSLAVVIIFYLIAVFGIHLDPAYLGIGLIVLAIIIILAIYDIYINNHHKVLSGSKISDFINKPKINLAEFLDLDTSANILLDAIYIAKKYNLGQVSPICIFMAFSRTFLGNQLLLRAEIYFNNESEKETIKIYQQNNKSTNQSQQLFSNEALLILQEAFQKSSARGAKVVDFGDLLLALYSGDKFIKGFFENNSLKIDDVESIVSWYRRINEYSQKKFYWQRDYFGPGIGQDWASGFTPVLNYFSKDISQYLADIKLQVVAASHVSIIKQMEETFIKSTANNIILIGEAGIGKRTLINSFAQRLVRGQCLPALRYVHVIELDAEQVLSGANTAEIEGRFNAIFNETASSGNIILFINNFDNLVNSDLGELGTINASQFLIPYLKSDRVRILATTTFDGWHKKIESSANLANLFTKLHVEEPNPQEMLPVLEDAVLNIEYKNKAFFTFNSLKTIIELAKRFIHEEVFPEKAVNLAESISVEKHDQSLEIINASVVEKFVSSRYKVPAGEATKEEKNKLIALETELHQRIIDQDIAVKYISDALRRARSGLAKKNKPIGSFLFIGPTGVGKTETAKALADIYFGSEKNMIRFDMSEFQSTESINRLIGSENGAEQGLLSIAIKENPYTVFLFDELEKAHQNILNLFLQMLDEGNITDASGKKLDFTNSIIIATSNAGAEEIREYIQAGHPTDKLASYMMDYLQKKNLFKPEFLNRFDAVVCFKPLTEEHILAIAGLLIEKLKNAMKEKEITLNLTDLAVKKLAALGYDPTLGARPMQRVLEEKVENLIAQKLLKNEIKKGDTLTINTKDII